MFSFFSNFINTILTLSLILLSLSSVYLKTTAAGAMTAATMLSSFVCVFVSHYPLVLLLLVLFVAAVVCRFFVAIIVCMFCKFSVINYSRVAHYYLLFK